MGAGISQETFVHGKKDAISGILFQKHVYFNLNLVLSAKLIFSVCNMTGIVLIFFQIRTKCT